MNDSVYPEQILEPERYELHSALLYRFDLDRRHFLKVLGSGLLVFLYLDLSDGAAQESGRGGRGGGRRRQGAPQDLGAWLHIADDGTVTAYTGKVEVGQNARTSLTQAVAEELPVSLSSIRLVMGDTDLTPYDAGTFGSQTSPSMVPQLHRVGATAREALLDLAAEKLQVDRKGLMAIDGKVVHRESGRSLTFGELAHGQQLARMVTDQAPVTKPSDWKIAGTSIPKVNARELVTGRHRYSSDVTRPGMVYGKILRPPSFHATLTAIDTSAAEALPGVKVARDGEFVGVTASNSALAALAIAALRPEWKSVEQPSDRELFNLLERAEADARPVHQSGSVSEGLGSANKTLEQTYTVAYIAHVPLEPRAAVAEWDNEKLTVWTGTQRSFGVRSELAQAFRIPESDIRVIMPDTGSGYGGKHTGEAAIEAARLARAAGKPVKLVWTREEEFTWAYFRPAGVIKVKSGVDKDGKICAWECHNHNSGTSGLRSPYHLPNQALYFHNANSPLRQGSYRALAATANHFARETHMDELAHAAGLDPLEFRLRNVQDERLRAVLEAAARAFGWQDRKPAASQGFGIAAGFEKGSYLATCAALKIDSDGQVQLERVVEAFECGAVINPDHLRNQIEGAITMGLGGALFEAIRFENGKILNAALARYRVPRFEDVPHIEVVLVNRKDLAPIGAGETPIVGIAPAIGNAIFQATGVRLRSMPMAPDGVKRA